ncbi:MAG: helix-turn-helix domain-containing protein [Planctomycetaceae bacterium]|nr:helix-turn-helix domain-containing protein [Planctomycetaceae bacterium]
MTQILLDRETLKPLVNEVVRQTLAECREMFESQPARLAWKEDEAAQLIGMQPHQLRDRRLEGRVLATKIGRSWYYCREELMKLFADRRRA